jgi:hypothetical protein
VTESDYELVQVASGAWSVRARIEGETFLTRTGEPTVKVAK